MKKSELYSREWCDLVFEGRNRAYGAYELRKQTGRRYMVALGVVLFLFVSILGAAVALMHLTCPQQVHMDDPIKKIVRFEGVRLKEARPLRRPPERAKPKVDVGEQEEVPLQEEPEQNLAEILHPEDGEIAIEQVDDVPIDSLEMLRREAELQLARANEQTDGLILDSIPKYPGGIRTFMQWLEKTMVYPYDCVRRGIEGRVEVAFLVEPTGEIADPRVVVGAHKLLNQEALRVIHLMPKWIPATKNGKPIRTQVTLPIVFEL